MLIREIYIGVAPLVEDSAWKKLGGFGVYMKGIDSCLMAKLKRFEMNIEESKQELHAKKGKYGQKLFRIEIPGGSW